jgi:hypothetical protein
MGARRLPCPTTAARVWILAVARHHVGATTRCSFFDTMVVSGASARCV